MVRLRRVSCAGPGWTRRRAGRGFVYLDADGERLAEEDARRARELVIPPAWTEVWICPHPNGHLQAVGRDAAGRRQYLYHPAWRERQDNEKFERVAELGRRLPRVRRRVADDLDGTAFAWEWSTALAVRLLDAGYFRIGGGEFGDDPDSYGLTTLERRHVRVSGEVVEFSFVGKSGVDQQVVVDDAQAALAVRRLQRRRAGEFEQLLAFRAGRTWRRLDAAAVNDYLRGASGLDVTAKDFRTWHATVLAAVALAEEGPAASTAARRRAVKAAMDEVADYLGNTATIARNSYVDPRVVDRYEDGETIRTGGAARTVECRVLRLLEH